VLGRADDQRELLDAESVAGHLLPAGSVFGFLAEHRGSLFADELFADLFTSTRGRPSVPADVVATVIVLQTLHGLSDRDAADAVTFDLRWKAACGLPVTAAAFHPTTLTYWRRRLKASERPNRIFDAVKTVIAETGVLAGRNRRALDSTILDDAVATQDTVTQLIAAIRRVRREVPGAAAVIADACTAHDYDDPGKPLIAWDDQTARAALVDALVHDALAVLAALEASDDSPAADALGCSRWSPVRTSNWSMTVMTRRGGGSPGGSPKTGSSPFMTRRRGTGSKPTSRSSPTPGWSPTAN